MTLLEYCAEFDVSILFVDEAGATLEEGGKASTFARLCSMITDEHTAHPALISLLKLEANQRLFIVQGTNRFYGLSLSLSLSLSLVGY